MKKLLRSLLCLLCFSLAACEKSDPTFVQGYIEGEFVYVASPFAGQLKKLSVDRGRQVKTGDPLFLLDDTPQRAALDAAAQRVAQAKAQLEDARAGQRPSEINAIQAQLAQAEAALILSKKELSRQEKLFKQKVTSTNNLDTARSQQDQDQQRVIQLKANLETARIGSRKDQVVAAEKNLEALEAALKTAEWNLSQMQQSVPVDALVSDVLYRPGDWVKAGQPVVELLPPGNVKVRAFVSQDIFGLIRHGDEARIFVDGVAEPFPGRVSFLSPRAEYTPPVIFSQQMREKFTFLVELSVPSDVAKKLHPGQPVDVRFSIPDEGK
ncbi:MAG: HlyD family secretion protein [Chthoniobacterales bacterium]